MPDFLHTIDPDQLVAHHAWMRRIARSLVLDDSEADDGATEIEPLEVICYEMR